MLRHTLLQHTLLQQTLVGATAFTALLAGTATAQDQAKMKANFAEMKTHDWYVDGGWTVDFDAAKAEAEKSGKPIFAYFTRTYAP